MIVELFEIRDAFDPNTDNDVYYVIFAGFFLWKIEVPPDTSKSDIKEAIIMSVFNDGVRKTVQAYLAHE